MIDEAQFKIGEQPCGHFEPLHKYTGTGENFDTCPDCDGSLSFCTNCMTDHHSRGLETCAKRISRETSRTALRMGLFHLTALLNTMDDCALAADLGGVRRVLCDQRGEIWTILDWLGTPVANTNSNSNSEEQGPSRITNSSSKEGERQAGSPLESTNTKFEEQAP